MASRKRRRRVRRFLRQLRERLHRLFAAERNRDQVTKRRRRKYRRLRDKYGDDDPRTKQALRNLRESVRLSRKIDENEELTRKRIEKKERWLKKNPEEFDPNHDGIVIIDGIPLAAPIAREVLRIRGFGRWKGHCISGWRSKAKSTALCIAMCGQPQCPGRCAGAASRHAMLGRAGAVDVDVANAAVFREECARHDSWLENHLPNDPNHFSDIGN